MTCLKTHYFALQGSFEVHLHKVKQFLPQCLGWESNESKEIYFMILKLCQHASLRTSLRPQSFMMLTGLQSVATRLASTVVSFFDLLSSTGL